MQIYFFINIIHTKTPNLIEAPVVHFCLPTYNHRQVRKVTMNKGVFPSDTSLEKLVYLAYRNIREKWTMPLANWAQIAQQLAIKFGRRFEIM